MTVLSLERDTAIANSLFELARTGLTTVSVSLTDVLQLIKPVYGIHELPLAIVLLLLRIVDRMETRDLVLELYVWERT